MHLHNFRRVLCGSVLCIPLTAANAQTILYVNDDAHGASTGASWTDAYTDVQPALAAAQSGDQIWVAAGRYVGNFTLALGVELYGGFTGTETAIGQRDWKTNPTILDGNQTGSAITAPSGATATTRVDGFTITNGSGTVLGEFGLGYGGAVYLKDSSPTIANNTIKGNSAAYGGGLYLEGSSPTVANNTITENYYDGLYLDGSSATILNNSITRNQGGLYLSSSNGTIANNTITGNFQDGGLRLLDSSPTIANNVITGNSASYYSGGGLRLVDSSPLILNNTITLNSAYQGGGLYLEGSSPTIVNSIIAFNSSGIFQYDSSGTSVLRYNCVYGNTYNYIGLADPTGADGNISADPRLADLDYGDVHIQPDSPCVDAGSNAEALGDFDVDGHPRIQPVHGTVDIGADESDGTSWPPTPHVIMRVSTAGDDANDGSSWALAKRTVQAAVEAAATQGGEVWAQAGTYYERIYLFPFAHVYVYGGFAGSETVRAERNWIVNVTTLDGQQQGSVVSARYGYRISAIDGFTITNGSGYGVDLYDSSPTIANNTITGCSDAGLRLNYSQPAITNNTITGNYGSGLYLEYSSPTITSNTITGNRKYGGGGGLYVVYSSPTITDNAIMGNSAYYDGGGLYLYYSSATIASNTIMGNGSNNEGGGLFMQSSSATITNNTITGNSAALGGGLFMQSSSAAITNNTIMSNSAYSHYDRGRGGGLFLTSSSPMIMNNTITGNSALGDYGSDGGGLYLEDSSPTIANTIVAFNLPGIYRESGTPTLRYNCVYGNRWYNYVGLTDPTGTDGNISVDPLFADPRYGNAHLQPDSPCVNAGNNVDAYGDFDIDAQPRIQPAGGRVDMGADESDGAVWAAGPYTVVRVSPVGDDANDGSSWTLTKRTVQAGINLASALGGEVWVQAGAYAEGISLHPYAYVYGGFAGRETARDKRDCGVNLTTLDGQQQGSVVTARGGYGAVGAIDGFTITNGSGTRSNPNRFGGGVLLEGSSPTIANNTITGNSADYGGGLHLSLSFPAIVNNMISGNNAWHGGGLSLDSYSFPTIANNTIIGNSAASDGGGLYLRDSSPTVANNTVTGNSAAFGGGLYLYRDSSPTIANTIVAFNSSGMYLQLDNDHGAQATLRYNCVSGNTAYNYDGLIDPTGTDGNISADPMFVRNPSGGGDGWGDDPATPDVDEGANDDLALQRYVLS